MRSSTERITAVYVAWYDLIGESWVTAGSVLKRIAGAAVRDPKAKALSDAIAALYPRQRPNAKKLGQWFVAHRGIEAGGYRSDGDYSSDRQVWSWNVSRVPTKTELLAEEKELHRVVAEQDAAVIAKATRGQRGLRRELAEVEARLKLQAKRENALREIEEAAERRRLRAEQRAADRAERRAADNGEPVRAPPDPGEHRSQSDLFARTERERQISESRARADAIWQRWIG